MHKYHKRSRMLNRRVVLLITMIIAAAYLIGVFIWGCSLSEDAYAVNFSEKFLPPSPQHWFGTDNLGRDMFFRSIKGLSISMIIGLISVAMSSVIAIVLGILSAVFGGWLDKIVNWSVDLCMGLPHLVLLILISFMLGKGVWGITIASAVTHWPTMTRMIRQEVLQVRNSQYVLAAYKMGRTPWQVAVKHIIPHILPVYFIGATLLFPHCIMHESAVTFLGFGLPKELPAIGVILAEAMTHIVTGKWWLAVFPGIMLLVAVIFFDLIGEGLKNILNPNTGNE